MGLNPYPPEFNQTHNSFEIISNKSLLSKDGDENKAQVSVAGRIMARRIMGKRRFFTFKIVKELFKCTFAGMM